MARLLIVEPHCSGHRMQYVRWVALEALSRGHSVELVTLSYCLDHPLYLAMQRDCGGAVRTSVFPASEHLGSEAWLEKSKVTDFIRREFIYHRLFSRYFRALPRDDRPDSVFVPYLDYCTNALGILGSPFGDLPWGGIVMRTAFHFEAVGLNGPSSWLHPVKRALFFRVIKNASLQKLFTIDETLSEYVRRCAPAFSERVQFVPDPAQMEATNAPETRARARETLGVSDDGVILLVYGALSLRKGIDALLVAAQHSGFPTEVEIILAGKLDEEVRQLLSSPEAENLRRVGRLHELDGFLNDEEERTVFKAADMVWMGYRAHYGMSGVLVQAAMAGLAVIACDTGILGLLTRKYKLGFSVPVNNTLAIVSAISILARDRGLADEFGKNGTAFAARHAPSNFTNTIFNGLSLD